MLSRRLLYAYGEELQSPLASYGINGVSMSFDSSRTVAQGGIATSNAVMAQLRQSGLASRLIPLMWPRLVPPRVCKTLCAVTLVDGTGEERCTQCGGNDGAAVQLAG